jgi:glycosyltransferase involved in cell wall biosynthesis
MKGSGNRDIMSISVVIPTYYRSNDLAELFESILRQTIMPFEVIVVDDTPTNEIKALCEDYGGKFRPLDSELTYVKNAKERSITTARNIGAKMTKGDIIMFFDSDISLCPDYIENILDVFRNYPNALGVQGWITNIRKPKMHPLAERFEMIFSVHDVFVEDQCKYNRYPITLTRIINCEHLEGANMSFRHHVLEEFQFDENLKKYSWMEDMLFGFSVRKRYPNSLYITPYARCIHKWALEGRMETKELRKVERIYRHYVLSKVFGFKGAFLLFKQDTGFLILEIVAKVSNLVKRE